MRELAGANVIVTGGSSGIGLATAVAFARRGANVGIVGRDLARLEAACEAIEQARRDPAAQSVHFASADLTDWEQARRAIDDLVAKGLDPDVLVNSAGVILPGEFATMPIEYFERNMDAGLFTVMHPCRAVAPHMMAKGSGHIVNVGSSAGFIGLYGYTAYSAAKSAVQGFTEALRFEMKPHGIGVSLALPSDTDTPALALEKTMRPPELDAIAGNVKAVSPSRVGEAIVRGVERGRFFIFADGPTRFYFHLKGLWPGLLFSIVDGHVRKARAARSTA